MIYKGLNQEDAEFLGMVSQKQAEIDDKRYNEESEEMHNYRVSFLCCFILNENKNMNAVKLKY